MAVKLSGRRWSLVGLVQMRLPIKHVIQPSDPLATKQYEVADGVTTCIFVLRLNHLIRGMIIGG
jgi:hypothetical protein